MSDCECEGGELTAQSVAAELYQLAALLMGGGHQAAELVEAAIAGAQIDPCAEAEASIHGARLQLVEAAVRRLSQADSRAFDTPASAPAGGCIEDDDLAAAGVSAGELARMVRDPGRGVLRDWLNRLPVAQRVVFVVRAILGWDNAAAASALSRAAARPWQPGQVSELFRQALCSLASSLAHASAH